MYTLKLKKNNLIFLIKSEVHIIFFFIYIYIIHIQRRNLKMSFFKFENNSIWIIEGRGKITEI